MIEPISSFISRFETRISLDENLIVEKQHRYFLLSEDLRRLISKSFFYAGTYLGKTKGGRFFASFDLLGMIAEKKANKVTVDKKTEWLFICGRDVFRQGITRVMGHGRKGDYTLVLNQHEECLGFGEVLFDLGKEREGVAIRNISDVGDFLRRER